MSAQEIHGEVEVELTVDGRSERLRVEPRLSLADALRDQLGVTGVRVGCEQGVCGTCTVVIDDVSQRSCLVLAIQAEGSHVTTVAGLSDAVDDLRAALTRHFALQCGFCASGLMVTAAEWLAGEPDPDEAAVRRMLSGNICRCSGYEGMVRAIVEVAEARRVDRQR
jgi:2-furoyl-CoA dehydrogenase 2Fe-2S iron sulfur subunit